MTRLPRFSLSLLFVAAALAVGVAAPAFGQSVSADATVILDAPADVDYWVCGTTGTRVHWGAAGIVIDEWDTMDHGFDHDTLVWYRYRYIYPDGRTYRIGYDYTVRAHPDPCVRPGTWACHNWPCNSPDALVEFNVTPVRVEVPAPPPPPRPDYGGGSPPYYSPPHTTVTVNTRWYPPPPTVTYSTSYSYGWRSSYGFYAGWHWGYHHHHPYHDSRYALAAVGLVAGGLIWAHTWDAYQSQNAHARFQSRALREQYRQTLEAPEVPAVEYIADLRARLGNLDQYNGSAVDSAPTDVLTDAEAIFAAENWPTPGEAEDEASRVPARLYERMPLPRLDTVANEKEPGEVMASMTSDLLPLTTDSPEEVVESVALIDQALGLWSGGEPRLAPRGPLSGQSRELVSENLLEPVDPEERSGIVRVIENAANAFDELTHFVGSDPETGEITMTGAAGDDRPVFGLASNGSDMISAVPTRNYQRNPEPVNVLALVPSDEDDPLVTVSTSDLERTVNFHEIPWRPLPDKFRELTGDDQGGALLPPPALRGNARQVWESFTLARSRD